MLTLQEKLTELENKIKILEELIKGVSAESTATQNKLKPSIYYIPLDFVPDNLLTTDVVSGLPGGKVVWNTKELNFLRKPSLCTEKDGAFNCHFHDAFSGGALDVNQVAFVEYERVDADAPKGYIKGISGEELHPDCQSYWSEPGKIKAVDKTGDYSTNAEAIKKIGPLALIFDPQDKNWGTSALEINVGKCNLVMKENDGTISKDSKEQSMFSLLYDKDITKTSVVWDKNAKCWRFYAVYYGDITSTPPTAVAPTTATPNAVAYPAGEKTGVVTTTSATPAPGQTTVPKEEEKGTSQSTTTTTATTTQAPTEEQKAIVAAQIRNTPSGTGTTTPTGIPANSIGASLRAI